MSKRGIMCLIKMLYRLLKSNYNVYAIRYKKHTFKVLLADTLVKQMLGLMYRPGIKADEGMLFKFKKSGTYPIWMLNMRFPIDILWLNARFRVVDIIKDAKPCRSIFECKSYLNSVKARYVLEINAGISDKINIRVGSKFRGLKRLTR